ncbi:hypothetical protein EDB83DRAFT_2322786 [Lactarius deliciosus]|nr:hypothetical protein EDB83DRAFT_2322786 [Lactarius deliciosus]
MVGALAISGYQWDRDMLAAYNIHVQHQDSAMYFGMDVDELPLPASLPNDDKLLTELEAQDMEDLANKELINLLDLVMEGFEESYENKHFWPGNQAEPQAQLITEAIVAFTHNNHLLQDARQETLNVYMFLEITLVGTMPTFYKIHVTSDLKNGMNGGMYPPEATNVFAHAPLSHLPSDPI